METKTKIRLLNFGEGVGALTLAGIILGSVAFFNYRVNVSEKNTDKKISGIEETVSNIDSKVKSCESNVDFYTKEFSKQYLELFEQNGKNEIAIELISQQMKEVQRKTANYNLAFTINNGGNKKDIKVNKLNNEYMGKLFEDIDTIYNTVNEKGSFKVKNKMALYRVQNSIKYMNENDKLKFKDLDLKNSLADICEVNIERAE